MNKIVIALALATSAAPAFAEGNFYIEALLGSAEQETDVRGIVKVSGDDASFGIRGGYQFFDYAAIEVAYLDYGEADDTYVDELGDTINDKFETTAINVGVKGILPFEMGFSIIARLGLSFWDYEVNETDSSLPGDVFSLTDDGVDFYYGVGAQYDFNDTLFIGVEYTIVDAEVSLLGVQAADHEVSNVSLSFGGKF